MTLARRLVLALCATVAAALSAAPAQALTLGISDQQPATFSDRTFYDTGITKARYIVPWDGLTVDAARVDQWMRAAHAAGADVMVAFNRSWGSRCPSSPCVLPTVDQYTAAVKKFLTWYPWVKTITPWNEVNDQGQPTDDNPTRAAAYYQAVVKLCPTCTVLGADVIDNGTQLSWLSTFLKALPSAPRLWGLHNYVDGNYFRATGTESVLNAVPGEIWLTETGGLVKYATTFPFDEKRAADVERFLLSIADAHPDRITRYYHYLWKAGSSSDRWDSGLLRADGTTRPAFDVLKPLFPGRPAPPPAGGDGGSHTPAGDDTRSAATPGTTTTTRKPRPVIVTRGRGRKPLKLRVACLAAKGKRCRGSVRVAKLGTVRFSLRAGTSRAITLRRRTAPRKPRVTVALTAPSRQRWTEVPAVAVPRR
ncbi:MAG TPA: glycosyl hydrolase [Solirubrobacteraceae bacterium]